MKNKNLLRNIVSLMVAFIMLLSCTPVHADWFHDMIQGGGGGSGGTAGKWNTTWVGEEFIRCSVWFYEGGKDSGKEPIAVGYPTDFRHPKYTSPNYGLPVYFSNGIGNQNTARYYNLDGDRFIPGSDYYNMVMPNVAAGKTKAEYEANAGNATLEFPILFTANGANGGNNGVDALDYFSNYIVHNNILASVQGNKYTNQQEANGCWQGVDDIESGIYHNEKGETKSGQYIILIEPGIYCKMNGSPAALTFRDCIALNRANNLLHEFVDPPKNCANSLMVGEDWLSSLGLTGDAGIDQLTTPIYDADKLDKASKRLGAGVITCSPSVGQIPVINYYYDLTEPGKLVANGLDDRKTVWTPILSEDTASFDKEAKTSERVEVSGNTYVAPLIKSPPKESTKYKLVMGYMSLKDDIDSNLDIKSDWKLQLYDTASIAQITPKCITHTNSKVTVENDVKIWNKSKTLVSSTEKNSELTGISEKLIQQDGDSLKAVYGNSVGKYQAVLNNLKDNNSQYGILEKRNFIFFL